jgi:D-methionine transport system substrate-binding protein
MKKNIFYFLVTVLFCACSQSPHPLRIAASSMPHAEILEAAREDLRQAGIQLEIITIDDYNIPNRSLAEGEVDANYFQHTQFLNDQMYRFTYRLTAIASIHIEPLALYSLRYSSLNALQKKDRIAIPNDPTNETRALQLLASRQLITLSFPSQTFATIRDIISNPLELDFIEVDAPLLPRVVEEVAAAVIPLNYALQKGFSPLEKALLVEDSSSPYANVLVVRSGDENRPDLQKLKEILKSDNMQQLIAEKYRGALLPAK